MKYKQTVEGIFLERPNRFIAYVLVEGVQQVVHMKNTGNNLLSLSTGCRRSHKVRRRNFKLGESNYGFDFGELKTITSTSSLLNSLHCPGARS
jgi:DNA-binding sugar fermentation-stimulating protein